MINLTKLLGIIALVVVIGFSITGCNPDPEPAHVHDWGAWNVTTAANCTTTGSQTRTCALDATHTETEVIPINDDHDWGEWEGTVTCETAGTGTRVCSRSPTTHIETNNNLQPLGHNYQNWTVTLAATCTTKGEETGICTHDNSHTTTRAVAIDPTAHSWGEWVGTVTCTTAGTGRRVCLLNGEHTEEGDTIPALGHNYQNWTETTAPTCTVAGVETGTCTHDNSHTTARVGAAALGHNYQTYTETTAPTCSEVGKEEAPCTRDSNHEKGIRDIAINPDAHQWKNTYNVTTPATCSATGIETDSCSLNTSHTRTRTIAIDPNAHNYGNWITTAPTCTTTGIDTRTCSLNTMHKETRNETAIDPNAHNWNTETGLCNNNCGGLYYNLGDTGPGGGKIFYVSAEGFTMTDNNTTAHYLEAAPADLTTATVGLAWASSAFIPSSPPYEGTGSWTNIAGTGEAIGTGRKNTALILATDAHAPAAKACNDYSNGGKTDWFLPSKDELNQLYVNRTSVGNMGESSAYWSSSQDVNNTAVAWSHVFYGYQSSDNLKNGPLWVRAVRAF